jgi:hypothetical protein
MMKASDGDRDRPAALVEGQPLDAETRGKVSAD